MTKRILIAGAIFIAASLFIATTAKANDGKGKPALAVELKVTGTHNNQPIIQLYNNGINMDNEYTISIKDDAGIELYFTTVKGDKLAKSFIINTEEVGDTPLNFEITEKNSGKSVSYRVQQAANVVKQTSIVKL